MDNILKIGKAVVQTIITYRSESHTDATDNSDSWDEHTRLMLGKIMNKCQTSKCNTIVISRIL